MSVISLTFLIFAAAVVVVYFMLPMKVRAYWLLGASLFFYGCYDIRCFLFLGFTAVSVFYAGKGIARFRGNSRRAKCILAVTIAVNVGLLAFVKFFGVSLSWAGKLFRVSVPEVSIPAVLGISFYTLQAVGYLIDIYRGKYAPADHFCKFLLYMTYFPIIMQGPISRYDQLADQLSTPHAFSFDELRSGLGLALWGFFKKLVIADRAGLLVDRVFGGWENYGGCEIMVAVVLYAVQIYADFSGFVDISRGFSQILGIELGRNFNAPYFADSIQDFWRRWHMSLSSWFRDYLYIPLGGSRRGRGRKYLNLTIVFLVSGLWHGAGLHYIVWGLMQAVFQILGDLTLGIRRRAYDLTGESRESFSYRFGKQLVTFGLVCLSWLFFRADSLRAAFSMLKSIVCRYDPWVFFDGSMLTLGLDGKDWNVLILGILVLLIVSVMQQKFSVREKLNEQAFWLRYAVYIAAVVSVVVFGVYGPGYDGAQFLYMQF